MDEDEVMLGGASWMERDDESARALKRRSRNVDVGVAPSIDQG